MSPRVAAALGRTAARIAGQFHKDLAAQMARLPKPAVPRRLWRCPCGGNLEEHKPGCAYVARVKEFCGLAQSPRNGAQVSAREDRPFVPNKFGEHG